MFGFPNGTPKGGFMDPHGNFLLSLSGTNEILVFNNVALSTSDIDIDFKISPNPASDLLQISSQHSIETLSIQNLQGQKVLTKKVNADAFTVDLNKLIPGTYFVVITSKNQVGRKKIIIH